MYLNRRPPLPFALLPAMALALLLAAGNAVPAMGQDHSAMNGTYVSENSGQVTLTYEGEGTVSVHVDDGELFIEGYGSLYGDRLVAVYNDNNEAELLIFYGQDYLLMAPSTQQMQSRYSFVLPKAYTRVGSGLAPTVEALWLDPDGEYTNDEGSLTLEYQGEGTVMVRLQGGGCSFEAMGNTFAGRAVQVFDQDGTLALMVFYEQGVAAAVPTAGGVCDSLGNYIFTSGDAEPPSLQGYFQDHRPNGSRTYMNDAGRVTLTLDGEGMGSVEIVTEGCDFADTCYFFPPHVATVLDQNTNAPMAVFHYTDDALIVQPIARGFCTGSMDFWDPFYSETATPEQFFVAPEGHFEDQDGNAIDLTYFGEGMVEVKAATQTCSFTLQGQTFMSHGLAIYDDMAEPLALIFYQDDYVVVKSLKPAFCNGDTGIDNMYQRVR